MGKQGEGFNNRWLLLE